VHHNAGGRVGRCVFSDLNGTKTMNFQIPSGENIILSAYASLMNDAQTAPTDLVSEYERHFVTAVKPSTGRQGNFERFSLIDPTIRTIVKSSTTGI
jgi:hypothetical protein